MGGFLGPPSPLLLWYQLLPSWVLTLSLDDLLWQLPALEGLLGGSLVGRSLASTACQHPPEPPETGGCLSAKPPGAVRGGRQPSDYATLLDQK